jgi:hypothetical protein
VTAVSYARKGDPIGEAAPRVLLASSMGVLAWAYWPREGADQHHGTERMAAVPRLPSVF